MGRRIRCSGELRVGDVTVASVRKAEHQFEDWCVTLLVMIHPPAVAAPLVLSVLLRGTGGFGGKGIVLSQATIGDTGADMRLLADCYFRSPEYEGSRVLARIVNKAVTDYFELFRSLDETVAITGE